jgi:glucose-1-phosphate thymidylyltransferase
MKGIVLAGGTGSRLWPTTIALSKQLIPVYDKPLIYYPLSTLMLAGVREILIITTPQDDSQFKRLLGDGGGFGIELSYAIQENPDGIAQAFLIGEDFIRDESVALILGDNVFHGAGLGRQLFELFDPSGAIIFGYEVKDPQRYGVAEVDDHGNVISIEEKPSRPKSSMAVPGLYFFDNSVIERAKKVKMSQRGELEITSVLDSYLDSKNLKLIKIQRGTSWMDCGTISSLNDASNYIRAIEDRQNHKVACIEEIAFNQGWISKSEMIKRISTLGKNEYTEYLERLIS